VRGFVSSDEAVRLLSELGPGAFVIRFSESRAGHLAVTYVGANGKCQSSLIEVI